MYKHFGITLLECKNYALRTQKSNLDTNNNILNESWHRNIGVIVSEEYDDQYQVSKCDGT